MRITLVTETFAPQINGVSRTLNRLVSFLESNGDDVQVVFPDYALPTVRPQDVAVRSARLPFYPDVRLPIPPFGRAFRKVDKFRPDLIHVATEATLGFAAMNHASRRGYPIVSSFHTNWRRYCEHYGLGFASGIVGAYLRHFHNRAIETYVPSNATIRELEAEGYRRLVLWPRGVDSSHFRPDRPGRDSVRRALGFRPEDVVIGHVGRIAVEKNVEYLAGALETVCAQSEASVKLLFVGDGPERTALEERLGAKARFVGYRSGEDLADHYAAADLFAFSSLTETFGNVVLEALASGLPVVALNSGGVGDLVRSGIDGSLLSPSASETDFADELLAYVLDPQKRLAASQAAREQSITRSWKTILGRLRDRYEGVVVSSVRGRGRVAAAV